MKEIEEKDELNLITLAQEYSDEDQARGLLESLLWPDGAICPHCNPIVRERHNPGASKKSLAIHFLPASFDFVLMREFQYWLSTEPRGFQNPCNLV
jgi:hypothetical protein